MKVTLFGLTVSVTVSGNVCAHFQGTMIRTRGWDDVNKNNQLMTNQHFIEGFTVAISVL